MSIDPAMPSRFHPPRLDTKRSSEYLQVVYGIRRTARTLEKLRWSGGGPAYQHIGRRGVAYPVTELDAWANALLGRVMTNTADR